MGGRILLTPNKIFVNVHLLHSGSFFRKNPISTNWQLLLSSAVLFLLCLVTFVLLRCFTFSLRFWGHCIIKKHFPPLLYNSHFHLSTHLSLCFIGGAHNISFFSFEALFFWFSSQMIRRQHPFFFQSEVRWTSTHIVNPNNLKKMHERLEMNQFSFIFSASNTFRSRAL